MRIEYQVGLGFGDGEEEAARQYAEVVGSSEAEPEKHELFAYLLLLAARREWRAADTMRDLRRDAEKRQRRRQEREASRVRPAGADPAAPPAGSGPPR